MKRCRVSFLTVDLVSRQAKETVFELHRMMLPHKAQLETSPWAGLAELTNLDGAICVDACQSQAWSSSTLLDLMHDIDLLRKDGRLKP
jgi:glycogen debranching enzyme